jgi:hypothetical protein
VTSTQVTSMQVKSTPVSPMPVMSMLGSPMRASWEAMPERLPTRV